MGISFKNIPIKETQDDLVPAFICINYAIDMRTPFDHHVAEEYAIRL